MTMDEIDTPALLVDLDAFERNLDAMAASLPPGVRLRPHAKTHKSPVVARAQIARGAVGVCCQKVSEAEVMVEGGVDDVLVTNEIWGGAKLDRLAALATRARIGVAVDHPANIRDLAAAAAWFGARLDAYVEIDVGAGRCGIAPGTPAVRLAEAIAGAEGLRFAGLQAYQGAAQHVRGHGERRTLIAKAVEQVRQTLDGLAEAGLDCPTVTGAGTGTWEFEAGSGVYTELQAGSYCFMDADYARNIDAEGRRGLPFRAGALRPRHRHAPTRCHPRRDRRRHQDLQLRRRAAPLPRPRHQLYGQIRRARRAHRPRGHGQPRRSAAFRPLALRSDDRAARLVRLRPRPLGPGAARRGHLARGRPRRALLTRARILTRALRCGGLSLDGLGFTG